jgi:hypothetical protein
MANKILLVFIALNLLFAACGGLLLAVVLMTRTSAQAAPTISNVAQNLLMDHCPLIGKISCRRALIYMLTVSLFCSYWNQCHLHLCHLYPLHTCHGLNYPSHNPPVSWLRRRLLRRFLNVNRLGHLVRDTQNTIQHGCPLGTADTSCAESSTAKVPVLWLHECYVATIHFGQHLHQFTCSGKPAGVCHPIFQLRKQLPRSRLHCSIRYRGARLFIASKCCLFVQGSQGAGEVQAH